MDGCSHVRPRESLQFRPGTYLTLSVRPPVGDGARVSCGKVDGEPTSSPGNRPTTRGDAARRARKAKNHRRREALLTRWRWPFLRRLRGVDNDGLLPPLAARVDRVQVDAFGRGRNNCARAPGLVGQIAGFRGSFLVCAMRARQGLSLRAGIIHDD